MARPRFRSDLATIPAYSPGRAIGEVMRTYGLQSVAKLASNENPEPPWPEVQEAMARHLSGLNRYPDNDRPDLHEALAAHLGVPADRIWCGGASNELTLVTALSMGGPGTSAVHAWPSFGLYMTGPRTAFAEAIAVPLTRDHRHDLDAMLTAVRNDTTTVFVCNPNNPTSTHVGGDDLERFVDALPGDVLVVIDEAYHEYVDADDYRSMVVFSIEKNRNGPSGIDLEYRKDFAHYRFDPAGSVLEESLVDGILITE